MGMQASSAGELAQEDQMIQVVIFHIRDEEFGVPIDEIQEIIKLDKVTPIPDSPKFIKGIINVRGEIVTTIDMKERFFMKSKSSILPRHIVITRQDSNIFGLVVDEVTEVLKVNKNEIKSNPAVISKMNQDYVKGVMVSEDRLIIILDLSKILSEQELSKLSDIHKKVNKKIVPALDKKGEKI